MKIFSDPSKACFWKTDSMTSKMHFFEHNYWFVFCCSCFKDKIPITEAIPSPIYPPQKIQYLILTVVPFDSGNNSVMAFLQIDLIFFLIQPGNTPLIPICKVRLGPFTGYPKCCPAGYWCGEWLGCMTTCMMQLVIQRSVWGSLILEDQLPLVVKH